MTKLKLTRSAFEDGGEMPRECGYKHGNEVPPLKIKCAYTRIKSLALIMDDPDAMEPAGKVWVHWVVWNIIPLKNNYASGAKHAEIEDLYNHQIEETIYREGMTDFEDQAGYGGPAPPDKRHTYIFKLYALDTTLILPDKSTKADVEKAMEGHIIEQTQLTGTYAP